MADFSRQQILSSELLFRAVVLVLVGALALGIMRLRFCYGVSLPAKPPMPDLAAVSPKAVAEAVDANPIAYAGYLEQDSRAYMVRPATTPEQMKQVLAHRVDSSRHVLDPRGTSRSLETAGLKLTISVRDIPGTTRKMMVLGIENLLDRPVAYRVVTEPDSSTKICHQKQHLAHNALALPAGGREERSECLYRRGWRLEVVRVETIELTDLSYHYVSRLPPETVGGDSRVTRGHRAPRGAMCSLMLPAAVRSGMDSGRITWRDVIDFYARHRCETYMFPENYKAFTEPGERPLPVMPPR